MEKILSSEQEKKGMGNNIEALRRLQSIHNKIRQLNKDKEYRRMDEKEKQRQIQAKKAELEEKQKQVKSFQKTVDMKELDLKTKDGEIQKLRVQLNTAKTNKEYSSLLLEIRSRETDNSLIEDEILKMLSELESMDKSVKELAKEIEEKEKQHDEFIRMMEAEIVNIDKETETLKKDEERFFEAIHDEDVRYHYKRLINHRDGIAVVGVSNHACLGCNMGLTSQTINLLMGGDRLVFCHNCGRILYLDIEKEE